MAAAQQPHIYACYAAYCKAALLLNASFLKTHLRLAGLSQVSGMQSVMHTGQLGYCDISKPPHLTWIQERKPGSCNFVLAM